jgi:beta-galactosidase
MKPQNLIFLLIITVFASCTKTTEQPKTTDWTSFYQKQTGKPVSMVFASYKTTMIANGKDTSLLRFSAADSADAEILNASFSFEISVKGDATLIETDGSLPEIISTSDTMKVWKSKLENGIKKLKLVAGTTPGIVKVEAKTEGLWPASHEIHTVPGDFKLMKPSPEQLTKSAIILPKMVGADISFLPQLESRGMKFSDNGVESDAISILKNHGINYIRLRIFVNPENAEGYSPGEGFCGLDSTLSMAKRVKAAGLNLLLDFHYSDTWADPQKQFKPKAWENLNFAELTATLKDYTKMVLLKLKEQGTLPDMVQIGNEINHGIVWPEGHISNPDNLAALLKAGTEAVKEVDPEITVMMHLALGGQNEESVFWFDNMIARGVQFDIIGLSYYPRWHCTLDDLNANMLDLINRYQKDVNVVEYSAYKMEIHDMVFSLPDKRGNGACIWEPLNTWSRVFDREGKSLESLKIYDEISGKYLAN